MARLNDHQLDELYTKFVNGIIDFAKGEWGDGPNRLLELSHEAELALWKSDPAEYLRQSPPYFRGIMLKRCEVALKEGRASKIDPLLMRAYKELTNDGQAATKSTRFVAPDNLVQHIKHKARA